jgi:hypothetical protein
MTDLRVRIANAIAAEIMRQDYEDIPALGPELTLPWLDQGEVDFGLVSDAVLNLVEEVVDDIGA